MLDPSAKAEFDQRYRTVRIIHAALMVSIVVYLGIGYMIGRAPSPSASREFAAMLVRIFYVVGAGLIASVFLIRRLVLPSPEEFVANPLEISSLLSKYQAGHILVYALSEAIAILGFVLLFLTGSYLHLGYFALVSLILMAICTPKRIE